MKRLSPLTLTVGILGVSLTLDLASYTVQTIYQCPKTDKGSIQRNKSSVPRAPSKRLLIAANSQDQRAVSILLELKSQYKDKIDFLSYYKEVPQSKKWGRVIEIGTFHSLSIPRFLSDFSNRGWTNVVSSLYNRYSLEDAGCYKVQAHLPSPLFESNNLYTYLSLPENGELSQYFIPLSKAISILIE